MFLELLDNMKYSISGDVGFVYFKILARLLRDIHELGLLLSVTYIEYWPLKE